MNFIYLGHFLVILYNEIRVFCIPDILFQPLLMRLENLGIYIQSIIQKAKCYILIFLIHKTMFQQQ